METTILERIQVEILTGIAKTDSAFAPLTGELDVIWDEIARDTKKIEELGGIVDVVAEIPEFVVMPKNPQA